METPPMDRGEAMAKIRAGMAGRVFFFAFPFFFIISLNSSKEFQGAGGITTSLGRIESRRLRKNEKIFVEDRRVSGPLF
jgi:hypothetical protein